MKKFINILATAAIALGGVTSCTLDAINYVEKTPENFPITSTDASQALAGIYQNLSQVCANPQMSFFYLSTLASDDNLGGGGTNDKLMQAMDLLLNYQNDMTHQFWTDRYQGINRANALLSGVENMQLEDAERQQVIGEAKFLRGFFYYELASQYGRVPLVLTTEVAEPTQPTAAELWGQILMDLRDAAENMPSTRKSDGHVDKFTAEAMLGRAWLFYTGMYGNGDDLAALTSTTYNPLTEVALPDGSTLTKQDVIGYIDDCVNNSGYSLVPDYRNLWAYTNRCTVEDYDYTKGQELKWVEDDAAVNPESMFAIKFNKLASWQTTIGYANGYALHFGIRGGQDYANTFPFGQGWGAGPVAPNLVNDWNAAESGDMRRDASVQNVNDLPNYTFGGGSWADFVQETDYYAKKQAPISARYTDGTGATQYAPVFEYVMYGENGWQNDNLMQTGNIHDLVLIRFADVLLMQSELKEDVGGINQVRGRSGLAPIGSYSLEALQKERRWELAFEGVRWNDIRRWHIAAAALEKQTNQPVYYLGTPSTNTAHNGGYAARYNATAGFFKIPETEISLANGGLTQNEGWTDASSEYGTW
ncbi:RagB/SusD family nutrient uptake outer membrane protein [Bacteroides sp. An51A]|uniref:RagB/SusD family nutrient uptake outer membrane protein n=1 Tax=Bacteroides sp. An51A TaxID=1965640 RepID=UPI000B370BA7|nr:RagB/SusD family nutrient uptake outer membrane protein [Bacteroides sp. An51A]OUN77605.1 RagB/SusD family nutrient uptake outer membrane protein [Bacteroides sp. An51A]